MQILIVIRIIVFLESIQKNKRVIVLFIGLLMRIMRIPTHLKLIVQHTKNLFVVIILFASPSTYADEVWIDVDTSKQILMVMQGNRVRIKFVNISIGRFGTTDLRMKNDNKTPLGRFKVGWINEQSRYYRFFGLDFPNRDTANRALDAGKITEDTWLSIINALNSGKSPPQSTPLGGYIGIHGIGRGNPDVHEGFNWTNGCVAVTNDQIDLLSQWIKIGMVVEIR